MKQRKVHIREKSFIARIAARKLGYDNVALVFRNTIHLHNTSKEYFLANKAWLCHELKHVEQYRRMGTLIFLIRYTWESIRTGYYNNKYEQEARASESDLSLLKHFDLSEYGAERNPE